jgi:hypothetical protein
MKRLKIFGLMVVSSVLLSTFSEAAVQRKISAEEKKLEQLSAKYEASYTKEVLPPDTLKFPVFTKEDFEKKTQKRKIASGGDLTETDLSPDFRSMREEYLNLKTPDAFDSWVDNWQMKYATLAPDAQLFVTAGILIKPLRGFIWRMIPLMERPDRLQFAAYGYLKSASQSWNTFLSPNVGSENKTHDLMWDYFVMPAAKGVETFKTVNAVQDYLFSKVSLTVREGRNKLAAIADRIKASEHSLVIDLRVPLSGLIKFAEGTRQYRSIGLVEIYAVIGSLYEAEAATYLLSAYNVNSLPFVLANLIYKPIDFSFSAFDGYDSKFQSEIIRSFAGFGTLRCAISPKDETPGSCWSFARVQAALPLLESAVSYRELSWKLLKAQTINGEHKTFTVAALNEVIPTTDARIELLKNALKGPVTINSPLTTEQVTVNLRAFFDPAKGIKDLRTLLPTDWDKSKEKESLAGVKYRDFRSGRATAWSNEVYGAIFPDAVASKDPLYVAKAYRVLSLGIPGTFTIHPRDLF